VQQLLDIPLRMPSTSILISFFELPP